MFLILLRRELLANLMTFRFSVAMIVCLLLVVANSMVLIGDYERRLADYNTAVQIHRAEAKTAKTYSFLQLAVDRPPNPLSIFNGGADFNAAIVDILLLTLFLVMLFAGAYLSFLRAEV